MFASSGASSDARRRMLLAAFCSLAGSGIAIAFVTSLDANTRGELAGHIRGVSPVALFVFGLLGCVAVLQLAIANANILRACSFLVLTGGIIWNVQSFPAVNRADVWQLQFFRTDSAVQLALEQSDKITNVSVIAGLSRELPESAELITGPGVLAKHGLPTFRLVGLIGVSVRVEPSVKPLSGSDVSALQAGPLTSIKNEIGGTVLIARPNKPVASIWCARDAGSLLAFFPSPAGSCEITR